MISRRGSLPEPSPTPLLSALVVSRLIGPAPAGGVARPDEVFEKSRYITSEVRERVQERAGHQCQYQAPDGTRCRSRTKLQIEHQRPFALFRSHDEKYLQLFCRQHNRWSAEKVFGAAFVRQKIDASRRASLSNDRADSS